MAETQPRRQNISTAPRKSSDTQATSVAEGGGQQINRIRDDSNLPTSSPRGYCYCRIFEKFFFVGLGGERKVSVRFCDVFEPVLVVRSHTGSSKLQHCRQRFQHPNSHQFWSAFRKSFFDESATMYGYSGALPDATTSSFTASTAFAPVEPFGNQLPSLPPPPSDSPPVPSTPAEPRAKTVQRSRRVRKEVNEANTVTSTCSRAPTARKRLADGEVSEQPRKKAKST
ncbi:hypothetical protein DFH06DRAFT_1258613 [Mycena polygramma]|nr:hypothetical protein DFH06DRAFT_1258613 [Mycena polygramma]